MKQFLEDLLKLIVDHPDKVVIEEQALENNSFQYNINAQQEDIGKIIGKDGKIIQAIRSVAKILAVKENIHIRIQII